VTSTAGDLGISVVPPGDTRRVSTQLRLVEAPKPTTRATRAKATRAAKPASLGGRRAVHWGEWQLDARTRRIGRAGVAAARRALEEARQAQELRQAS
jgi:hypothetical protein